MTDREARNQKLLQAASTYKTLVTSRVKGWDVKEVQVLIEGSVNPAKSGAALSKVLTAMCDAEERLYDVSVIRMEVRSILTELEMAEHTVIKKEFRKVLDLASDGVNVSRTRYEHLQTVLGGLRSINANMRNLGKN